METSCGHSSITSTVNRHFWEDDCGITHDILQGEGGEQRDPLMPLLFSLGLAQESHSVSNRLLASEKIFAFLDDIYLVCHQDRVEAVYEIVRQELRRRQHRHPQWQKPSSGTEVE